MNYAPRPKFSQTVLALCMSRPEFINLNGGLNVTAAAKAIDIPQPTLKRIIDGTTTHMRPQTENKISSYFGISRAELYQESIKESEVTWTSAEPFIPKLSTAEDIVHFLDNEEPPTSASRQPVPHHLGEATMEGLVYALENFDSRSMEPIISKGETLLALLESAPSDDLPTIWIIDGKIIVGYLNDIPRKRHLAFPKGELGVVSLEGARYAGTIIQTEKSYKQLARN